MKLTRTLLIQAVLLVSAIPAFSSGNIKFYKDPLRVTFNETPHKRPDLVYQDRLRSLPAWQDFAGKYGNWSVIFDESSQKPYVAFGTPVSVAGATPQAVATNFINSCLRSFMLPTESFEFVSVSTAPKYFYVNFKQKYQGLEVMGTRIQVKMTHDMKVMQFSMDCFDNITTSVSPGLNQTAAMQQAVQGVGGVEQVVVGNELKVLPIPAYRKYNYHLVYEVTVSNRDAEGIPGKYYTLVDAATGEILYRVNKIHHFANTDVTINGTLYVTHPYDPSTVEPLRNMKFVVGGVDYYTDNVGYLGLANTSPVTATVALEGLWADVRTNGTTPTWTVTLNPGANNLTADNNTDIKQRTVYHSVNVVHDYMKTKFPSFTLMDNALPSNVDIAGTCNAFYDGSSINFLTAGGGCNATSLIADVCYHEYGHGINDKFYQSIGASWDNGAMGEGYADLWAMGITGADTLGIGFFQNDPTGFVREYVADKKVYPQDLVGEVHADGEIICGAWWDTYKNLGNLQQMMDLFAATFYSGVTDFDGNEGVLFPAILLEALLADDNDGNLQNGTPNYCAISSGFAIHGITLTGVATISHSEILESAAQVPITVDAVVQGLGTGSVVKGYYRVGNSGPWTFFPVNNTGGNNFQGSLPAQPEGVIVEYYMGIEDNCGTYLGVIPQGANDTVSTNIPYYILVGFNELVYEDFDTNFGNWQTGLPSDNNTTGTWIIDIPVPSYVGTAMVQTDDDFTPGGLFCALTGNAPSPTDGAGTEDVDGGATTLETPTYDLSTYTNPAFTFHRWYSNDQGATPGTDYWQVYISGDGVNFVPVEYTRVADHSWRRFAFRVLDYITPTSNVKLRFVAEDANAGSLIEAAVDDLKLWDATSTGIEESASVQQMSVYPNPAGDEFYLSFTCPVSGKVNINVLNNLGQKVYDMDYEALTGDNQIKISSADLAAGLYQVRLVSGTSAMVRKISVR